MSDKKFSPKDNIVLTKAAQREVDAKGYTTACGGVFSNKFILNSLWMSGINTFFRKTEPAGVFMSDLEKTNKQIEESTEAIIRSGRRLVDSAKEASQNMVDVNRAFRDNSDKMSSAIDKMMQMTARKDFKETVDLAINFVEAMERLSKLEQSGLLEKVTKAMSAK